MSYQAMRTNTFDPVAADPVGLTPEQLRALPVAFPFGPIVPLAFGVSRSAAYRALAAGQLPITPLRRGRRLIVRRADLLEALSIPDTT
jgi:hypothetical protein